MIKIKLLLLSLIALPLACNAQEKIVETYDNGQIKSIYHINNVSSTNYKCL